MALVYIWCKAHVSSAACCTKSLFSSLKRRATPAHAAAARGDYAGLLASAQFMGLLGAGQGAWLAAVDLAKWADQLAALRAEAMASKN